MLSRIAPASVALIDTAHKYTDPPGGPADIADDLLPFNMDGLDRQSLSAAQKAGFPDLWGKADSEDSGYIINKGVLYSIWTPSTTSLEYPRIVLPPEFHDADIDRAHTEVGHMATQKTLARLQEAYVWPHMRESVRARLNKCVTCAVHNPHNYQTIEHVFHNRFVAAHGSPETLISDNGAEFTAKHWTAYLTRMGIKYV